MSRTEIGRAGWQGGRSRVPPETGAIARIRSASSQPARVGHPPARGDAGHEHAPGVDARVRADRVERGAQEAQPLRGLSGSG